MKKKKEIIPNPLPGENEFAAYRRAYFAHHNKPITYQNERFEKACAKAYLQYTMTSDLSGLLKTFKK